MRYIPPPISAGVFLSGMVRLSDLLLQVCKKVGPEKFLDRNVQAVTQFFNGGDGGAVISAADDIVYRRLRYAAETAQLVHGNISFVAQLDDPLPYRFAYAHADHLFSRKMIPIST